MEIEKESNRKKSSLTYKVENIVVNVNLNPKSSLKFNLDLEKLSKKIINAEYEKKRFAGMLIRFLNPKCVARIFKNGKMILIGLKFFNDIEIIINRIINEIKVKSKINIDIKSVKSEIVNIVTTAELDAKIDLDMAAIKLENIIFEPEIFPALIYKSITPVKCVFLVFNNGKIVLAGIKEEDSIEPALVHFGQLLKTNQLFLRDKNKSS